MKDFYYLPEATTAKNDFEINNTLSYENLLNKVENSMLNGNVIGAKVINKGSNYLVVDLGLGIKGILNKEDCDFRRRNKFMNRAVDSFINVTVSEYSSESECFVVTRKKIVFEAQRFHIENESADIIVKGIVTAIYENNIEVDIFAGNVGNLHIGCVADTYIKSLNDFFFVGQEANFLVKGFNKSFSEFDLSYYGVRQSNGIKPHTVIEAEIVGRLESDKKASCIFPDYNNEKGIVIGIPKGFCAEIGMKIPVTVVDIRHGLPITKF